MSSDTFTGPTLFVGTISKRGLSRRGGLRGEDAADGVLPLTADAVTFAKASKGSNQGECSLQAEEDPSGVHNTRGQQDPRS